MEAGRLTTLCLYPYFHINSSQGACKSLLTHSFVSKLSQAIWFESRGMQIRHHWYYSTNTHWWHYYYTFARPQPSPAWYSAARARSGSVASSNVAVGRKLQLVAVSSSVGTVASVSWTETKPWVRPLMSAIPTTTAAMTTMVDNWAEINTSLSSVHVATSSPACGSKMPQVSVPPPAPAVRFPLAPLLQWQAPLAGSRNNKGVDLVRALLPPPLQSSPYHFYVWHGKASALRVNSSASVPTSASAPRFVVNTEEKGAPGQGSNAAGTGSYTRTHRVATGLHSRLGLPLCFTLSAQGRSVCLGEEKDQRQHGNWQCAWVEYDDGDAECVATQKTYCHHIHTLVLEEEAAAVGENGPERWSLSLQQSQNQSQSQHREQQDICVSQLCAWVDYDDGSVECLSSQGRY